MNVLKNVTRLMMLGLLAFNFACDTNEDLIGDGSGDEAVELIIDGKTTKNVDVYVSDLEAGATTFDALVEFTSSDASMKRLYITENYFGKGDEPYELKGVDNLDLKGDGAVDLDKDFKSKFSFDVPFEVYPGSNKGEVVYTLWATSGNGDYRDNTKRLTVGVGTITVIYGGNNPATDVKEYTTTIFAAPLADGSSETFISLLDGKLYKISEGEEFGAFWDFGYYFGNTDKASFASTANYPSLFDHDNNANTALVNVATLVGLTAEELNNVYFNMSNMDFAAVTKSSDLDGITASTDQRIRDLEEGALIEFVDNYGKKGLIKVISIETGFAGSITVDIKVQP